MENLEVIRYGIIGASLASSVCTIFWNIVFSLKIKEIFGFSSFYKFRI